MAKIDRAEEAFNRQKQELLNLFREFFPEGDAHLRYAWSLFKYMVEQGFVRPFAGASWEELFASIDPKVGKFLRKIEEINPKVTEDWSDLPPILHDIILPLISAKEAADEIIRNRGMTQDTRYFVERAYEIAGATTPEQQAQVSRGLALLADMGYTPTMRAMREDLRRIAESRGQTPETQEMFSAGMRLASGEMPSALREIYNAIQNQLESGAQLSEETRQFMRQIMGIIERGGEGGAVMPLEKVSAREEERATRAFMQAREAAERQAAQRLGTGAVAAGTAEGALTESYLAALSEARAKAMEEYQQLKFQQFSEALRAMTTLSAQQLQSQTALRTYGAAALADLARAASSYAATGADLATRAQQLAVAREQAALSQLGELERLASQNMQLGASMLSNVTQQRLAGIGAAQGMLGLETQRLMGAIAAQQDISSTIDRIIGNYDARVLQAAGFQLDKIQAESQLWAAGLATQIGMMQQYIDNVLRAGQGITQTGVPYFGLGETTISGEASAFGDYMRALTAWIQKPSWWQSFLGAIGQGIGGAIGGGLFGLSERIGSGRSGGTGTGSTAGGKGT